ncbi:hypothetical protein BDQ17DRAFT_621566 [Cyathus striatus]|nr:hypothetical protein BDQ17DRAFT_621566 [Cyathus striatus]
MRRRRDEKKDEEKKDEKKEDEKKDEKKDDEKDEKKDDEQTVETEAAKERISKRTVKMSHFLQAMNEVPASSTSGSHSELRRWHEQFGKKSPVAAASKPSYGAGATGDSAAASSSYASRYGSYAGGGAGAGAGAGSTPRYGGYGSGESGSTPRYGVNSGDSSTSTTTPRYGSYAAGGTGGSVTSRLDSVLQLHQRIQPNLPPAQRGIRPLQRLRPIRFIHSWWNWRFCNVDASIRCCGFISRFNPNYHQRNRGFVHSSIWSGRNVWGVCRCSIWFWRVFC